MNYPRVEDLPAEFRQPASLNGPDGLLRQALHEWSVVGVIWVTLAMLGIGSAWSTVVRGDLFEIVLVSLAVLVIAGRFHALGVVLHDAVHSHLFRTDRDCRDVSVLQFVAGYPIATTLAAMRYHHLRHHARYGTEQDPYRRRAGNSRSTQLVGFLRGSFLVPLWLLRPIVALLSYRWKRARGVYRFGFLQDRDHPWTNDGYTNELLCARRAESGQLGFWLAVIAVGMAIPGVGEFVLSFWLLPLWIGGMVNVWRVTTEHDHDYRRLNEVDFDGIWQSTFTSQTQGKWFLPAKKFLLYPRYIGYHQAHHHFPRVRLSVLPEVHRWLEETRHHSQSLYPRTNLEIGELNADQNDSSQSLGSSDRSKSEVDL